MSRSWSDWKLTNFLRWETREHLHGGYDTFLQQKWIRTRTLEDGDTDEDVMWEDVPNAED